MIITFWMYAYCLLDTSEYRVHLEARRFSEIDLNKWIL